MNPDRVIAASLAALMRGLSPAGRRMVVTAYADDLVAPLWEVTLTDGVPSIEMFDQGDGND